MMPTVSSVAHFFAHMMPVALALASCDANGFINGTTTFLT